MYVNGAWHGIIHYYFSDIDEMKKVMSLSINAVLKYFLENVKVPSDTK